MLISNREDGVMKWSKQGLLIEKAPGSFTHASHPTVIHVKDDEYLIAFCGRNELQYSHVFFVRALVNNGQIEISDEPELALEPGRPGEFDCHGILTCNFVRDADCVYLYYCGWQNLQEGMWICDTGRAIVNLAVKKATRQFHGPILARDKDNPLFAVATAVLKDEEGTWFTWYNKGLEWNHDGDSWIPKYGIHFAHSLNGVDWKCEEGLIIPFKDKFEHSFGRPTVLRYDGRYFMWFACRGAGQDPRYKIGFAVSEDGRVWKRTDSLSGINVSSDGWDGDAICYPSVFVHQNKLYMLYNGNNYGLTGFGFATADPHDLNNLFHKAMNL